MNIFDTICGDKTVVLECKAFNQQRLEIAVYNPCMRTSLKQERIPGKQGVYTVVHVDTPYFGRMSSGDTPEYLSDEEIDEIIGEE